MFSKSTEFNELKGWTPPIFHTGSECYISFTAFCPTTGKMRRKRIMLDHIKSKRLQKDKAQWMIPSGAVDERVRKKADRTSSSATTYMWSTTKGKKKRGRRTAVYFQFANLQDVECSTYIS